MLVVRGGLLTPAREPRSIVGQKAMRCALQNGQVRSQLSSHDYTIQYLII